MSPFLAPAASPRHPLFPGATRVATPPQAVGPSSNTGQKYPSLSRAMCDFLTVVCPPGSLRRAGVSSLNSLVAWLAESGSNLVMTDVHERRWQFYEDSATLLDATTGEVAGKVGLKRDTGAVCISLSGQGCKFLGDLAQTAQRLDQVGAHITRLDIAKDDLRGEAFNLAMFKAAHAAGEFSSNGRPPCASFVDDLGSGKGCTLYIGQKGHKQLCVYEKGKQLGDPSSAHVRCELRLYAKHVHIPNDALTRLEELFAGGYPMLAEFAVGEIERLVVEERFAAMSGEAMLRATRNQSGRALNLVLEMFDTDEQRVEFIKAAIARPGRPARFKSFVGDLPTTLRHEWSNKAASPPGEHLWQTSASK